MGLGIGFVTELWRVVVVRCCELGDCCAMAALKQAASLWGVRGGTKLGSVSSVSRSASLMSPTSLSATARSYRMVAVRAAVSGNENAM